MQICSDTLGTHLVWCLLVVIHGLCCQSLEAVQTGAADLFSHPYLGQSCGLLLLLFCEAEMRALRCNRL